MNAGSDGAADEILLVEDDEWIRQELAELLTEEGYSVMQASNGAEALATLHQIKHPCVILLDLMMPVMNGWGFRAAQRADAELASIPVVIMTGATDAEGEASKLGAAECLRKPFEFDEVLEAVHRHCANRAHAEPRGPKGDDGARSATTTGPSLSLGRA
jgi:CheY-like chemotaxis protein